MVIIEYALENSSWRYTRFIIMSKRRFMSFWRNNDVIITSRVCWDCTAQFHHHCKIYQNMLLTSTYNLLRKRLFGKGPMYNYHWYDIVSTWPIVEYALTNSSDYHMVLLITI